jgi:hypothetical protein
VAELIEMLEDRKAKPEKCFIAAITGLWTR